MTNCYAAATGIFSLNSEGLSRKEFRRQRSFVTRNKVTVIRAVSIPVQPAPAESAEYRKQLAENYGFRQIGEHLPDDVTLKDVINSLPKKVLVIINIIIYISVMFFIASTSSLNRNFVLSCSMQSHLLDTLCFTMKYIFVSLK